MPIPPHPDFVFASDSNVANAHPYLAGYMARKIFKKIGACPNCKRDFLKSSEDEVFPILEARAYSPKALTRPNSNFLRLFRKCNDVLHYFLPKVCANRNVKSNLVSYLHVLIPNSLTCSDHEGFQMFTEMFVIFYIHMWVKNVNKILKGGDSRRLAINDPIKRKAQIIYLKHRASKKKIRQTKQLVE